MKILLLILLLPTFSLAQTIHYDDDKIMYEGTIPVTGQTANAVASRLQNSLLTALKKSKAKGDIKTTSNKAETNAEIKLISPYHIIRKLHFTTQVKATDNGYAYQIDSVYLTEKRRGVSEKTISSKELLEGLEKTGMGGTESEKLLNEIDMRLQKLIAILRREIR